MDIVDLLTKDSISTKLNSSDKNGIISELTDLLVSSGGIKKTEKNEIIKRLKERESLGSTGIGKGVAKNL